MSSDAIAKLPSPLRDLVTASVTDGSVNSKTKPEVDEWIEKVASGQVGKSESLKVRLHRKLGMRSHLMSLDRTSMPN
jgi:aminoacyl tRNA synthase complex-interacting multifunctional protein 1